jgi:hypothetical protein
VEALGAWWSLWSTMLRRGDSEIIESGKVRNWRRLPVGFAQVHASDWDEYALGITAATLRSRYSFRVWGGLLSERIDRPLRQVVVAVPRERRDFGSDVLD